MLTCRHILILHLLQEELSFTAAEEEKLQSVFDLDSAELSLVLETSEFFLHQVLMGLIKYC